MPENDHGTVPSSGPTPKKPTHPSSPLIHDLPPSGRGFVIGGVSGFKPSGPDEEQSQGSDAQREEGESGRAK